MGSDRYIEILQTESRKCLEVFLRACEENKLKYYLFYGSLLGAVRHKGFIPWDDDIDIVMPRNDYNRFISIYGNYYTEDYFLDGHNCANYLNNQPNCRINFKHLMVRKDKNSGAHYHNAFVSLFPIDGLPNNVCIRFFHIQLLNFLYGLLRLARSSRFGIDNLEKRSIKDRIFIFLSTIAPIGKLFSPKAIAERYNRVRSKYKYTNTTKSIIYWNNKQFANEFDSSLLLNGETATFDGLKCDIPSGWDELLKALYGNYMVLPPEEKRKPKHGYELKWV